MIKKIFPFILLSFVLLLPFLSGCGTSTQTSTINGITLTPLPIPPGQVGYAPVAVATAEYTYNSDLSSSLEVFYLILKPSEWRLKNDKMYLVKKLPNTYVREVLPVNDTSYYNWVRRVERKSAGLIPAGYDFWIGKTKNTIDLVHSKDSTFEAICTFEALSSPKQEYSIYFAHGILLSTEEAAPERDGSSVSLINTSSDTEIKNDISGLVPYAYAIDPLNKLFVMDFLNPRFGEGKSLAGDSAFPGNSITVFDISSAGKLDYAKTIPIDTEYAGKSQYLNHLVVNPNTHRVFLFTNTSQTGILRVFDVDNNYSETDLLFPAKTDGPGFPPQRYLVVNNNYVYLFYSERGHEEIKHFARIYDDPLSPPTTFETYFSQTINSYGAVCDVGADPSDDLIFFLMNGPTGALGLVDPAVGTITFEAVGSEAHYMAVAPEKNKVFITNNGDGTVSVIKYFPQSTPVTLETLATIVVGGDMQQIIYAPEKSKAYVPNGGGIAVIDATNQSSSFISFPLALAVAYSNNKLYVADAGNINTSNLLLNLPNILDSTLGNKLTVLNADTYSVNGYITGLDVGSIGLVSNPGRNEIFAASFIPGELALVVGQSSFVTVSSPDRELRFIQPLTYPSVFRPATGGPGERTLTIAYTMDKPQNVTVFLYDVAGKLVLTRKFGAGVPGGQEGYNSFTWNGVTDEGGLVGNGIYVLKVISDGKVVGKGKVVVYD